MDQPGRPGGVGNSGRGENTERNLRRRNSLRAREGFIVADNYFCKTRANIQQGSKGAILFLTKDRKSFQAKGPLSYHTAGPIFENMQSWHDPKYPAVGATLLRVEEAYSGAEKLI